MFDYCLGLETLDITGFNLDNISEKNDMFKNCHSLRELKLDANSSIGRSLKLEAPVYISDKGVETTLDTLDDAEYNVITTPTEPTVYYRSDFVDDTLAGLKGSGTKDDPYIVNDRDAALVLKYINGKATLSKEQKAAANVVEDNEINILDVIAILKKAS